LWAADPVDSPGRRSLFPHPEILQPASAPAPASAQTAQSPTTTIEPATELATPAKAIATAGNPQATLTALQTGEEKAITLRSSGRAATVAGAGQASGDGASRAGTGGGSFIRNLWPLLAVLVLIVGMALMVKKFMPARRLLGGSDVLKIVARTHVSPKQQLLLVKMGRRLVLLGLSPDRINSLSTVDDPDQVAMMLGEIASRQPASMTSAFAASMEDEREAYRDEPTDVDETEVTRGHVRGLLQKVRAMTSKGVQA
jgi:flagellar biogenesis protein FliO